MYIQYIFRVSPVPYQLLNIHLVITNVKIDFLGANGNSKEKNLSMNCGGSEYRRQNKWPKQKTNIQH